MVRKIEFRTAKHLVPFHFLCENRLLGPRMTSVRSCLRQIGPVKSCHMFSLALRIYRQFSFHFIVEIQKKSKQAHQRILQNILHKYNISQIMPHRDLFIINSVYSFPCLVSEISKTKFCIKMSDGFLKSFFRK